MGNFTLTLDLSSLYSATAPTFEVLVDGVVVSSLTISSTYTPTTLNLSYTGNYPSFVSFRFNDYDIEADRSVTINDIQVNGISIAGSSIDKSLLLQGQESQLDIFAEQSAFGITPPDTSGNNVVTGTTGDDYPIYGGSSNDTINALDGDDLVKAGAGDDLLYGGLGNDNMRGATGNDTLYGEGGNDLLKAEDGNDTVFGGDGNDNIDGGNGNDILNGGNGNDVLKGGFGIDTLHGDAGNDILRGHGDDDFIYGDAGNDKLEGGDGNDALYGGIGMDRLFGDDGDDLLDGEADHDRLYGGDGNDTLYGRDGNDLLDGGNGADTIFGGLGNDRVLAGAGDDLIRGEEGNDVLRGGDDNDIIYGGVGSDQLHGDNGDDTLYGGDGHDLFSGGFGNDTLYGEEGNDNLYAQEGNDTVYGGLGNDRLNGQDGDDILNGDDGNDRVIGGNGSDTLDGGIGTDTVVLDNAWADYTISETGGIYTFVHTATGDTDTAANFEFFEFSDGALTTVTILNVDPTITSDGGGATAVLSIAENTTAVTTVTGTDSNILTPALTYSISGGADAAFFTIDSGTGILSFVTAPDYEALADSGGNNIYDVMVTVSDGELTDTQSISVQVTDVAEGDTGAPVGMNVGDSIIYEVNTGGDTDFVEIDLVAGVTYAIWARGTPTEAGTASDPRIYDILDSNDVSVSNGDDDGGVGYESLLYFTPTVSDTYQIDAGAYGSVTGTIMLSVFVGGSTLTGGSNVGSANSDYLVGSNNADTLDGGAGNDLLEGGGDADILIGGTGADVLYGGAGSDSFVFTATDASDSIVDFSVAENDMLDFSTLTTSFDVNNDDVDDYVRFTEVSGSIIVSLDVDGLTGGSNFVEVATLEGNYGEVVQDLYDTGHVVLVAGGGTGGDVGNDSGSAGTIIVGGSVTYSVDSGGDTDWYGVDLIAGTTYAIWARGTPTEAGTASDPRIYNIYDSNEVSVSNGNDDGGVGYESLLYFTATTTGTYYIDAGAYGSNTGTITLSVFVGGSTQTGTNGGNTLTGSADSDYLNGRGGSDTLDGGDGSDILEGGNGSDTLIGGLGADVLYGGSGADTFMFTATDARDSIVDFNTGQGDVLDFSSILVGFNAGTDDIDDFIQFTTVGNDTLVSVDIDGLTGGSNFVEVAMLEGNTGDIVQTLYDNGDIIV